MHHIRMILIAIGAVLLLASPHPVNAGPPVESDLSRLVSMMSGSFSSAGQAAEDPEYFDITLRMVPIWRHRSDAHWFYVEQSVTASQDKPYRQRVYRVSQFDDCIFRSTVYSLPDPQSYTGEWQKEIPLDGLSPDDLTKRQGCTVILEMTDGGTFCGCTTGTSCQSSLNGAAYATSEVTITTDHITSWDRGFNADGEQIWGAEKGPYIFERIED